jgi:hypothetical protein
MPVLGIYASQISGHLWVPSGAYDSIATVTLGSASSPIQFTSIPQTYTHLQLRLMIKNASNSSVFMRFNSAGGTAYATHYLSGDGASARAGNWTSDGYVRLFADQGTPTTAQTNIFGVAVIDILDYTNTSKYKTTRSLLGYDANGSGGVELDSGLWQSTAAVTQIDLITGGTNFQQYTSAALYGVKGQ